MRIHIIDRYVGELHVTPEEWADAASPPFKLSDRVPGVHGEAFDLKEWFKR